MSELRYHPFLDTWVITATHRQDRTFLPPADYNPLAPTKPGGFPTEVPFPEYDLVVFENKFPSLSPNPPAPDVEPTDLTPVRPAKGVCEVVCYSQILESTFATMPYQQARKLTRVWKDRYCDLVARPEIEYVFIFENKGKEIGVTLGHPHGQIYAYPYIPPTMKTELAAERRHYEETGRPLMEAFLAMELGGEVEQDHIRRRAEAAEVPRRPEPDRAETGEGGWKRPTPEENGTRVVWQNDTFAALIPFFARYPYEIWVAPKRHLRSLAEMEAKELDDLAEILLVVTRKYDQLFGFSMPYIMAMKQEPGIAGYEFTWFHIEFYPPYRTANKLKYLAGSEAGAGAFINDTLPEVTAETMRHLEVGDVKA